jgi:hypothetical protein
LIQQNKKNNHINHSNGSLIINTSNSEPASKTIVMENIVNSVMSSVVEQKESEIVKINNNNNNNINDRNKIEEENFVKMEVEPTKAEVESEVKDGNYYLKLLAVEKARILRMADDAEKELEVLQSDVSEI